MKILYENGVGRELVYAYWAPSQVNGDAWPCKIGKAKNLKRRINSVLSAMQEKPHVAVFYSDDPFWLEQQIHNALADRRLPETREWFMTSPQEIAKVVLGLTESDFSSRLIGHKIRRMRLSRKMTQAEVAKAAGMAQASISDIERGSVDVKLGTITRILDLFGAQIDVAVKQD